MSSVCTVSWHDLQCDEVKFLETQLRTFFLKQARHVQQHYSSVSSQAHRFANWLTKVLMLLMGVVVLSCRWRGGAGFCHSATAVAPATISHLSFVVPGPCYTAQHASRIQTHQPVQRCRKIKCFCHVSWAPAILCSVYMCCGQIQSCLQQCLRKWGRILGNKSRCDFRASTDLGTNSEVWPSHSSLSWWLLWHRFWQRVVTRWIRWMSLFSTCLRQNCVIPGFGN